MSSLTSTTTSAITLTNILIGAAIAIAALIFLLALKDVMSKSDSWNANTPATRRLQMVGALIPKWRDSFNANTAAALLILSVGLIVTFFAFFAFTTAQLI